MLVGAYYALVENKTYGWRLRPDFATGDVFVHIVIWTVLSIITFGVALVFWPYASAKLVLNAVEILDDQGQRVGRMRCDLGVGRQIGHALLWYILSVVTLGLALPFYVFGVARQAVQKTSIAAS